MKDVIFRGEIDCPVSDGANESTAVRQGVRKIGGPPPNIYGHDIRMFPSAVYEVGSLQIWPLYKRGERVTQESFRSIVVPSEGWSIEEESESKLCYQSNTTGSVAYFNITVKNACGVDYGCKLSLLYLFSWNATRVGDLRCSVHLIDPAAHNALHHQELPAFHTSPKHKKIGSALLLGNDEAKHQRATLMIPVTLSDTVPRGHIGVRCEKPDGRLSCIGGLSLTRFKL